VLTRSRRVKRWRGPVQFSEKLTPYTGSGRPCMTPAFRTLAWGFCKSVQSRTGPAFALGSREASTSSHAAVAEPHPAFRRRGQWRQVDPRSPKRTKGKFCLAR